MTYAAVVAAPVVPQKPSGPLKPKANGSDPSEPAVSSESAFGLMSGPLSGIPNGTTATTHVANICVPAGQRPNKTPILITRVTDTRGFLVWLRASCPCDLTAQLKAEKLMVVPSTADGFRATVSALRSLDGKEGELSHLLPFRNLGKQMPENVVREELEALNIRVQGVVQLRTGRREDLRCPGCDLSPSSAGHGGVVRGTEGPSAMQALSTLRPYEAQLGTCAPVRRVWEISPPS
jgi:hypothetical protein